MMRVDPLRVQKNLQRYCTAHASSNLDDYKCLSYSYMQNSSKMPVARPCSEGQTGYQIRGRRQPVFLSKLPDP